MRQAHLPAGPLQYDDTGEGPAIVLCPALWTGRDYWRRVVDELAPHFRCLTPLLPLGAHQQPMRSDADLTLAGHAAIVADFLEALHLQDVTLVFNDFCPATIMIERGLMSRVGRLVLVSVETDDNYPPGLPGRLLAASARVPGGLTVAAKALGVPALRRTPFAFGRMSHGTVPSHLDEEWSRPARTDPAVRRDLRKYVSSTRTGRVELQAARAALGTYDAPVLVVWGADDRVMPLESGRRLAQAFPDGWFVSVPKARTLVAWDQPEVLAEEIRSFVGDVRAPHRQPRP